MHKICVDFDFDDEKISEYLKYLEIDDKYKGIPAYEWQQTLTREQKANERRKKHWEAERIRRRELRIKRINEEREARKIAFLERKVK